MGMNPDKVSNAQVPLAAAQTGSNALAIRQGLLEDWKRKNSRNQTDWSTKPIPILFAPFVFWYPSQRQHRSGRWPSRVIPLWIPGQIGTEGQWLLPPEDPSTGQRLKPWVTRDYLEPLTDESILVLGSMEDVDRQWMAWTWPTAPDDWPTYLQSAEALMPAGWADRLQALHYQRSPRSLVVWDSSVRGTMNGIISVYEHLLEHPDQSSGVLQHFAQVTPTPIRELQASTWMEQAKSHHLGHINSNGQRSLNPAQRNALVHALALSAGDLMALNGPPGTGKTTWVHAFWSSLWTRAALVGDPMPPIVVVASTNNQAVGNVLDSLNRDIAAERWIPDIPARFGLLIKAQDDQRMPAGTWRASWNGGHFDNPFEPWLTAPFLDRAESSYRRHVNTQLPQVANSEESTLADVVFQWHEHLCKLFNQYEAEGNLWLQRERLAATFVKGFDIELKPFAERRQHALDSYQYWQVSRQDWEALRSRVRPWDRLAIRLKFSRRISEWQAFAQHHQWTFDGPWTEFAIHRWLQEQESHAQVALQTAQQAYDDIIRDGHRLQETTEQLAAAMGDVPPETWNAWADTHWRYPLLIAALHYWEGKWLLAARQQLTERSFTRGQTAAEHRAWWGTMAMLAPCFVTTLHSGSNQFTRWNAGAHRQEPLTDLIDWLILDESGQISPHLPGALMAIAQRAVIIGDVHQLQPVSGISESVDRGNAHAAGIATTESVYRQMRPLHVWAGSGQDAFMGSAMGRAQQRTGWSEAVSESDQRGMTLTDHHRCITPVISFCNELVYRNRIVPKRHRYSRAHPWPTWGYAPIWGHAEKRGGSWTNIVEAQTIAQWLAKEQPAIEAHYEQSLAASVAIVTPFKAQGEAIRQALMDAHLMTSDQENDWKVGTIHSIQGAERSLIIFSPTYTADTSVGTLFFDRSTEMLNVAVSRAKDSFWVFGDLNIFDPDSSHPSGLLARYLYKLGQEIPVTPKRTTDHSSWTRLDTVEGHQAWLALQWQRAQKRIVIISPFLSPRAVIADHIDDAIRQACQRQVSVTIYYDRQWAAKNSQSAETVHLLSQAGAVVVGLSRIHAKIVIVDEDVIAEGSFNWLSAERTQSHHMRWDTTLVYRDSTLIRPWIRQIQDRVKTLGQ